jgi:uncharacterized protein YycO
MRNLPKVPTFLAALILLGFAAEGHSMGARASKDSYHSKSLGILASKGGVSPENLENFWFSLAKAPRTRESAALCVSKIGPSTRARDAFLDCVSERGSGALSGDLGHALFVLRARLVQSTPTRETLRSLSLVTWTEDLVREAQRRAGRQATWMMRGKGYLKNSEKTAFDFQDGDVVVGLGDSSISSLISQITNTPSRYSHAFIVRKRAGKITTVESLVETGVREFPLSHLLKDPYNQLTVLRWKDSANRARVAARASDWAAGVAARKAPYDMKMDFSEDEAIYCSELIVKAYAKATGLKPKDLVRYQSRIDSGRVFKFANLLGVSNTVFFSPGDLFNSPYFEVVADYRKPGDLMKAWELYLMGDLFIERLEAGYRVTPGPIFTTVPLAVWLGQLLPSTFHEDARLIPRSIGPYAMSVMATTQIWIYNHALEDLKGSLKTRSLLDHPPWKMRGELERSMDRHPMIRASFSR